VVMSAPWLIVPLLALAGWIGWKIKAAFDNSEIRELKATLGAREGRLHLAKETANALEKQISELQPQSAKLQTEIKTGARPDQLASTSASIATLTSQAAMTTEKLRAIIIEPHTFIDPDIFYRPTVKVEPPEGLTKKSNE